MADVHNPTFYAPADNGYRLVTPSGDVSVGVCAGDPNGVVPGKIGDRLNEEGTTRWWTNADGATMWVLPSSTVAPPPAPILRIVGGYAPVAVLENDATSGQWTTGSTARVPEVLVHDSLAPWIASGLRVEFLRRQPRGSRYTGQRWTHPSPGTGRKWDGGGSNTFIPRTHTEWAVTAPSQVVPVHEFLLDGWFKRGIIKYRSGGAYSTVDASIPTRLPHINSLSSQAAWTSLVQPLRVAFRYSAFDPGSGEWVPGAPTETLMVRTVQAPLHRNTFDTVNLWPEHQADVNANYSPKQFTCSVGGR